MHPSHVANVDANAFLDDSCRAPHSTQHHSIAGSIKRKAGQNLLENLLITNAKLGQQETFHFQNTLQATPQVPGVPPPLAAVLHNLTNTLNTNHQDLTA
jgi:hypothetical protein